MSPLFLASIIGSVTWLFVGVVCIWITGIKVRRGNMFKTLVCILGWPAWIFYHENKK